MAFVDYEELSRAAEEQGVPINVVNEWYRNTANNPQVKGKSPDQIVQAIGMAMQTAQTGKIELPQPQLQKVEVTGQRAKLPTTVNPYAGTTQEQANPDSPNAASISQYDPAAMRAAQAEYNKKITRPGGSAGLLAAGFGGMDVARQNDLNVAAANKLRYDQTVGAQQRLQEQATAGEAALTSAQNREVTAGEFTAAQRKKQNELDMQKYDVQTRQRMNDANSPETLMAAMMLADQARASGTPLPKELEQMIADKKVTAEQLVRFMDPKVLDAYKAKVGIKETEAKAAQAAALADQAEAAARMEETRRQTIISGEPLRREQGFGPANYSLVQPNRERIGLGANTAPPVTSAPPSATRAEMRVDPAVQRQRDIQSLPTLQKEVTDAKTPEDRAAAERTLAAMEKQLGLAPTVTPPAKSEEAPKRTILVPSIDGDGNISFTQSTYSQQQGREAGQALANQKQQIVQWSNVTRPQIEDVAKTAKTLGGWTASGGRNIVNYGNKAEVARYEKGIDALNQEALALGIIGPGGKSGLSSAMGAAGAQISQYPGMGAAGTAMSAAAPLFNSGKPLTTTTNPELVRELAYKVIAAREKQSALQAAEELYARKNQGDTAGFTGTSAFNEINKRVLMVNKKGDYRMVDGNTNAKKAAVDDGYFTVDAMKGQ